MVTDMEAGVEHLSRATTRGSDVMLVIAEPYFKSLETAARVTGMAEELGIPRVFVVANKVRTEMEAQAIRKFSEKHGFEVLSSIPYDEKVAEASLLGTSPLDVNGLSSGVAAIESLAAQLEAMLTG